MSNMELREFHTFLEGLIERTSEEQRFSVDKVVGTILSRHPDRIEKIRDQVIALGLRVLIRNNCRAKVSSTSNTPDMFGHYHLDEIIARWDDRPTKQSRDRRDFDEISRRIGPYRDVARTVGEALEMADRDGR